MFRFRDIQLLNTKLVMHVISRHLDPIIKACKSFYKWVFSVQLVVVSVQRTARQRGFVLEATEFFSPLIATVPANATRSTSGFKQTVTNSSITPARNTI